ncbi:MAG: CrcB family protein [Candidatus Eremiobacteraeota bacterium]|nr:CrcB family protein [Candidatus Eremiobacteraeota bacterium]
MEVRTILVVALGAALGGVARLLITQLVIIRAGAGLAFTATLFINVTGSFAIGVVAALAQTRPGFSPLMRAFLATGILGGYTTFSTFSLETASLAGSGANATAAGYVVASVALGILAAFGGLATGRAL